jgi:hypothetical protein
MANSPSFLKDPQALLDYVVNWATWLGTDTIAVSTWTVPAGITVSSSSNTNTTATVWLSGGTDGTDYACLNHIHTAGGREEDCTITIKCRSK